ncbi:MULTISPECIES: hypothetical protein [Bacillus]|uniref:Uncharacterized protein n=1 Tax=Bacillus glycinifermentans TaxID=1664069 RepID=A0A0T6BIB2_9BACI|nr:MULTISPECIES: hypothetical protein [Bacillus]KRT87042.1 hypothetical protein AB447_208735 [Bacillus glycinifermentans]MEC0341904.1 hypothetical protein [Bacillus sonorensis]MEC0457410.1 hypothetical protein [Bacillus sonorensis]MEC0487093.1 hypothetical protein [Bacillus glycinifermentans]MEC0530795.1 hypothetical protein [Bacillus sonorensis]
MTQDSFKDFVNQIFQDEHSHISRTGLIPVEDVYSKKPNLEKRIEKLCELLSLPDDKNLYYSQKGVMGKYVYLDESFYFTFWSLEREYIEQFVQKGFHKKKDYCKKLLNDRDFGRLLSINDKVIGFHLFELHYKKIPVDERKALFIDIYSRSEYGFSDLDKEMVEEVLRLPTPKEFMLPPALDQAILTVYRGQGLKSTSYDEAFSWTLSEEVARFFANRFSGNGTVFKGKVKREDVVGYVEREEEILVFPGSVFDIERIQG